MGQMPVFPSKVLLEHGSCVCLHIITGYFSTAEAKLDCYSKWQTMMPRFLQLMIRKNIFLPSLFEWNIFLFEKAWLVIDQPPMKGCSSVSLNLYLVTIATLFTSSYQSFVPHLLSIYWGSFFSFASHHILLSNFPGDFRECFDPSELKITLCSSVKNTSQCFFASEEEWHL